MFRSTVPVAQPATDTEPAHDAPNPSNLIPLSHLELDLDAPAAGWAVYLADRGMSVVLDDVGRPSVTRADVRDLLTELREQRESAARQREEAERQAIERDRQWRAQLHGGIPASMIPEGVAPAAAMMQAEKDSRPRRMTPLQEALSGETLTFHSIRTDPNDDES